MTRRRLSSQSAAGRRGPTRFVWGVLLPVLCSAVTHRDAAADLASQYGLSPRAIGMGNAVCAVIDDASAVYYNPAGLGLRADSVLTMVYDYAHPSIRGTDPSGTDAAGFGQEIHAVQISYKQSLKALLPRKWERNIGFAILAVLQDDLKKGARIDTSLYGERLYPVFGRVQDILVVGAGAGLQITRWLYAGIGMRLAVTLDLQNITLGVRVVPEPGWVYMNTDANVDTEVRPIAGVILRPWPPLRIGAAWRSGGPVGDVVMTARGAIGDVLLPVKLPYQWVDFYEPEEIAASVAWEPRRNLLLATELTWARWSGYNVPYKKPPPGAPLRDILVPRFGLEYSLCSPWKFQLGYYYQPSAVRDVQPRTNLLDADKHVFSCGAQVACNPLPWVLARPLRFQIFLQYQYCPRKTLELLNGETAVWGYILNVGGGLSVPF